MNTIYNEIINKARRIALVVIDFTDAFFVIVREYQSISDKVTWSIPQIVTGSFVSINTLPGKFCMHAMHC